MNKRFNIIIGGIIAVICVIILIIIFFKLYTSDNLTISEIENMSDSELADFFYTTSKGDNFIKDNQKDYRLAYTSANTLEDAISEVQTIGQSADTEIIDIKLQEENDYYYVIYQEYISHRSTGDVNYKNYYLVFKNTILDVNNNWINTSTLNDTDNLKEIFDLYLFTKNRDNASTKLLLSELKDNSNEYIYTYYYFMTSYGDWGISDRIKLCESTITIDKENGKFTSSNKTIREVSGRKR